MYLHFHWVQGDRLQFSVWGVKMIQLAERQRWRDLTELVYKSGKVETRCGNAWLQKPNPIVNIYRLLVVISSDIWVRKKFILGNTKGL